jgi:Tol biopolymer transport system component/cytosine/adenosine deaminase-related metal-dependent hydrolase
MSLRYLLHQSIKFVFILSLLLGCGRRASSPAPEILPPVTQTTSPTVTSGLMPGNNTLPQGRLVFALQDGNKADIYTANIDGSRMVNLTDQAGILQSPVWSPDGKSIAYASESGIFVMNADGTEANPVPLSGPLDIPYDWSPDGRFLLVGSSRDVNREIYVVTLDGSRWINISRDQSEDGLPRWSPDGSRIAFVSDRDSPEGKQVAQVYLVDIHGGEISQLTDFEYGTSWPVWSPDGRQLAVCVINNAIGSSCDVYLIQANSKDARQLTHEPGFNVPMDWSPDGKTVLIFWQWGNNPTVILEAVDGSGTQVLNLRSISMRMQPGDNVRPVNNLDLQIPTYKQEASGNAQPIALINGVLIDGTGADPLTNAVLIIENGKITAVGRKGDVSIPSGAETIDLEGKTILPGFIDAQVHGSNNAYSLAVWIKAGVTTVCDLGSSPDPYFFAFRDATLTHPDYARIVAAGPIITNPGGYSIPRYGQEIVLVVTSAEDARTKVGELLDKGADIINIAMVETLSAEEVKAITDLAHQRGTLVLAHVDTVYYLELAVDNGVDIAAHMVPEKIPDDLIRKMVQRDFYIIPTAVEMMNLYNGVKAQIIDNMKRFNAAGGKLVLGDDYGNSGIQLGMPIRDLDYMLQAGLTPMQVILAGTKYAAHACHRDQELGTLEVGKMADILVVRGNPLVDINILLNVEMVLRDGIVVFNSEPVSK